MKFFYVYILYNFKRKFTYTGYTKNLKERLKRHNKGRVKSTKRYIPLKLIFYEAYLSSKDAKRREKYLKSTKGKVALRLMLKDFLNAVSGK